MNLPFILDIVIGLVFIYLILSLLAAEIQELLATLLQWRASHLKKSIQNMLDGSQSLNETEFKTTQSIVDKLYHNPLIKNINQEAKVGIEVVFRKLTWGIGEIYRDFKTGLSLKSKESVFGRNQKSAPSYIPPETFATTFLETIGIPKIYHHLTALTLEEFQNSEIKTKIKSLILDQDLIISESTRLNIIDEIQEWENSLNLIIANFKIGKTTPIGTINAIKTQIDVLTERCKLYFQDNESFGKTKFINDLKVLQTNIFNDQEALLQNLKPTISQIIDIINITKELHSNNNQNIIDNNNDIYQIYQIIDDEVKNVLRELPDSVLESLDALARRAQSKITGLEDEFNQFRKEIETWFDYSMQRASGVYKRNAKGVAFLIGFMLAFVANADTFHMINRLSKDSTLRNTISASASTLATNLNCPPNQNTGETLSQLDCLQSQVDHTLNKISLPIGWSYENLKQQAQENLKWQLFGVPLDWVKRFFGWIISALAISMGASFWFDLLSKIINVRNTGNKPASVNKN